MRAASLPARCWLSRAAWAKSGATILFAGNLPEETQTIPLLIYSQINSPHGLEGSFRLVIVSIFLAAMRSFLAEWLAAAANGAVSIGEASHEPASFRLPVRYPGGFRLDATFEAGDGVTALFGPSGAVKAQPSV